MTNFKNLKYSKKYKNKKTKYYEKGQNGGQPTESSIAKLDSDLTKNQPHDSKYIITHEDPEWPLNFSVQFETDSLSQHINKLTKIFLSDFPLNYDLANCTYDGNIVLEIINDPLFRDIAERTKFFIIKTKPTEHTIQPSSNPIQIVQVSREQLMTLTDPSEIESAGFIRLLAHTFHYLNRETLSKNVTLNGNKIIDSASVSSITMSETILTYTTFISALLNKVCRTITAKELLYILILLNAGDEKTTIFFNNFNYTTENALSKYDLVLNNINATLSVTDKSDEYSNPSIFLKRYENEIEKQLSLPNSINTNTLFQQIDESNSYFIKVSTYNDEIARAIKCEFVIKKYAAFFLYITLPTNDRMHKRKILGITLVEETSNLRNDTYEYGFKFIWTLNDATKKILMDSYDIQNAITYFPDIRVLHSGVKKSLHGIIGDSISHFTPMRSVGNATKSMRSKLGNMFTRKNRAFSQEEFHDKPTNDDELFGVNPVSKGGKKSKKNRKIKTRRRRITKKACKQG